MRVLEAALNQPIRILIVDDSPHFLTAMRDFLHLQKSLCVAGTATDGEEALRESVRLKPDIILLDLNLAGNSGLELIPDFRKHLPHVKIIVLTLMQAESYRTASLQAGADEFVHKSEMGKTLVPLILDLAHVPPSAREALGAAEDV